MMSLGIVLALNHMYDNWTIAGVMSAAYVLATAAVTPLYARLFDRFGQRKVGPVILTVQVIVMLGFAFAALMRVPIPLLFVLAVVIVARFTEGYVYGILSAMAAVVLVNYVFTYPYFELNFSITGYPLTFVVMLVVSLLVGQLTAGLRLMALYRVDNHEFGFPDFFNRIFE